MIARDYADGAMPADTDDDIPESAISRLRRRWQGLCAAVQARRWPAPNSDLEREGSQTKDAETASEKDPKVGLRVCARDMN